MFSNIKSEPCIWIKSCSIMHLSKKYAWENLLLLSLHFQNVKNNSLITVGKQQDFYHQKEIYHANKKR